MLKKSERLTTDEVKKLFEKSMRAGSAHISLRYVKYVDITSPKCAVIVSKKVAATAVDRNYARRKTYSALRPIMKDITPSHSAFIAQDNLRNVSFTDLEKEIRELLTRTKLLVHKK